MDQLADDAPAPRLCHLIKWPDFDGYGFNLHADRSNPGQFIGKIDDSSPAQLAGLHEGDRIIEVNGINISNENHRQVVERIKSHPSETKLLVVDPAADLWYGEQDLVVKSSQMNVIYKRTPIPRPTTVAGDDGDFGQRAQHEHEQQQQTTSSPNNQAAHQQAASKTATEASSKSAEVISTRDQDSGNVKRAPLPPTPPPMPPAPTSSSRSPVALAPVAPDLSPKPGAPMSPDSGAGDDDAEPAAPGATLAGTLTIEAEINRQSPRANSAGGKTPRAVGADGGLRPSDDSLELDTNEGDAKDLARLVHNGSADSGKSSSPDAGSSNDSLEDHNHHHHHHHHHHRPASTRDHNELDKKQEQVYKVSPITDTSDNNNSVLLDDSKQKLDGGVANEAESLVTNTINTAAAAVIKNAPKVVSNSNSNASNKLQASLTPSPSSQQTTVAVSNNNANCESTTQLQSSVSNNTGDSKTTKPMVMTTAPEKQQQAQVTKQVVGQTKTQASSNSNNNNNPSGLNLNMTASEMRELLARRKKFDPKKAQMNIRQKYEIIQQM